MGGFLLDEPINLSIAFLGGVRTIASERLTSVQSQLHHEQSGMNLRPYRLYNSLIQQGLSLREALA